MNKAQAEATVWQCLGAMISASMAEEVVPTVTDMSEADQERIYAALDVVEGKCFRYGAKAPD